jgi:hypothetical protein
MFDGRGSLQRIYTLKENHPHFCAVVLGKSCLQERTFHSINLQIPFPSPTPSLLSLLSEDVGFDILKGWMRGGALFCRFQIFLLNNFYIKKYDIKIKTK